MKRRDALTRIAALPGAWALPAHAAPAMAGEAVAWPEVTLLDGRRWSGANARGKAVVAVFWSTTCPFCQRHNAHVQRLLEQSASLPLEILGIARERDAPAVQRHLDLHGWRFPVTLDAAPMAAALSTRRMSPLTVTVDRTGKLLQVIPGEMYEDDVLQLARLAQ